MASVYRQPLLPRTGMGLRVSSGACAISIHRPSLETMTEKQRRALGSTGCLFLGVRAGQVLKDGSLGVFGELST